jgi:hypothetical protein
MDVEHCCLTPATDKRKRAVQDQNCARCKRFVPKGFTCCGRTSRIPVDRNEYLRNHYQANRDAIRERVSNNYHNKKKIAAVTETADDGRSISPPEQSVKEESPSLFLI